MIQDGESSKLKADGRRVLCARLYALCAKRHAQPATRNPELDCKEIIDAYA